MGKRDSKRRAGGKRLDKLPPVEFTKESKRLDDDDDGWEVLSLPESIRNPPEHDTLRVQLSLFTGLGGGRAQRVEFTFDGYNSMERAKDFVRVIYTSVSKVGGSCLLHVFCNDIYQPAISGKLIPGNGVPIFLS